MQSIPNSPPGSVTPPPVTPQKQTPGPTKTVSSSSSSSSSSSPGSGPILHKNIVIESDMALDMLEYQKLQQCMNMMKMKCLQQQKLHPFVPQAGSSSSSSSSSSSAISSISPSVQGPPIDSKVFSFHPNSNPDNLQSSLKNFIQLVKAKDPRITELYEKAFQGTWGKTKDKVKSALEPLNLLRTLTGTGFILSLEKSSELSASGLMFNQIAHHATKLNNPLAEELALALNGYAEHKEEMQLFKASFSAAMIIMKPLIPDLPTPDISNSVGQGFVDQSLRLGKNMGKMGMRKVISDTVEGQLMSMPDKGTKPQKKEITLQYLEQNVHTSKFARILLTYLAPARDDTKYGKDIEDLRMNLRHTLGATNDNRHYSMSTEERDDSFEGSHIPLEENDFMELFFTAGFKEFF